MRDKIKNTRIEQTLEAFLAARADEAVFLRREFAVACPRTSRSGIDKALRRLIEQGILLRFGYGLLARAGSEPNMFTGLPAPEAGFESCVVQALRKMRIDFRLGKAFRDYNERKTTQVPARLVLDVGKSRVTRKMGTQDSVGVGYERS